MLNEDFDRHVCDHQLQRQSDEFYTSTERQGDCTQHKPESKHLEWEDCDLVYIHIGNVVEAHCHVARSTSRERLMSNLRGI